MSSGAPSGERHLREFVLELGRALSLAGTAVGETQERLGAVARAYGLDGGRVIALPTALIVSLGPARPATIEAVPQFSGTLRLDQIAALYALVDEAEHAAVDPVEGLRRLRRIDRMPPRHGALVTLVAYVAMTVGLCLVLRPTLTDVALAAGFGALVGGVTLAARGRPSLAALVPVACATAVSALSFEALAHGLADPGLRTLIAPLVTFLPGGALTTGTLELASGEMLAGASRLVFGTVQMLLLAFGIVVGVELAGLPRDAVLQDEQANLLGWWAPWLGVLVFGLATGVYASARRSELPWLLVVLLAAGIGQLAGYLLVGSGASGFCGALVMTPAALAIARLPGGPPAQVTFLPAFWLLVPGALGLIGVTQVVGNPAAAAIGDLVVPVGSVLSVALGVLTGASVYRGLASRSRAGRSR